MKATRIAPPPVAALVNIEMTQDQARVLRKYLGRTSINDIKFVLGDVCESSLVDDVARMTDALYAALEGVV